MSKNLGNYNIFVISRSLLSFTLGLLGPFWILFIKDFKGNSIEQFGFSLSLAIFANAVTSYYVGKYSDKLGRKAFLIYSGIAAGVVTFSYTLIGSLMQLYILQILDGIVSAVQSTTGTAFLGDITKKKSRGKDIGKFDAITGVAAAIALIVGGLLVGQFGYEIIFYIASALLILSSLVLIPIKEK